MTAQRCPSSIALLCPALCAVQQAARWRRECPIALPQEAALQYSTVRHHSDARRRVGGLGERNGLRATNRAQRSTGPLRLDWLFSKRYVCGRHRAHATREDNIEHTRTTEAPPSFLQSPVVAAVAASVSVRVARPHLSLRGV